MNKFLLALTLLFSSFHLQAQESLQYTISFENAVHHEANISLTIPTVPNGPLYLRMSRSSPGRYATHEFGKNIYDIHAYDIDGKEIKILQKEGDVYEIPTHQNKVKITYILYGNWVDGTYAAIDDKHAHLNMPAILLWAPALQNEPVSLKFILRPEWKVATQLPFKEGIYYAPNLQYLMDSPVELSNYQVKNWEQVNTDGLKQQIQVVYHGVSSDSVLNDFETKVKRIVKEAKAIYGDLPKYDYGEYRFLVDVFPINNGDGMEHRNSTVITKKGESLDVSEKAVLSTVAHEFFHSWNVERIRPKSLEPFNFEKANMSEALWFAEGFTQYYGELLLARAGVNKPEEFINTQGKYLNAVLNAPGAQKYAPIFMSQRAVFVDAGVAVDQTNYQNIFSSYYLYGNITALALDLSLRTQFGSNLDDYMKAVWIAHGKTEIPYTIQNLEDILGTLTQSPDFAKQFFAKYIYGTEKADYINLLANAGYILKRPFGQDAWMGNIQYDTQNGQLIIASPAIKNTPLYLAGLDAGDVLLKLNDTEITTSQSVTDFLKNNTPGTIIKITYSREGKVLNTNLKLIANPSLNIASFEDENRALTPNIIDFRRNWYGAKATD